MGRWGAIVVCVMALVGVAGAVVALSAHSGEPLLRMQQSRSMGATGPTTLGAAGVQAFVAKAPEPVAAWKRTPAARVRCLPGGGGPLRNPWWCVIRYRSGTLAHYRVVVQPSGYYQGRGSGIIEGCCVSTPSAG
jgi:hypothetical protein